jgi:hypothetical protein
MGFELDLPYDRHAYQYKAAHTVCQLRKLAMAGTESVNVSREDFAVIEPFWGE